MGIMELIICTVFPDIMRSAIVHITDTMARIIGETMRDSFLKKNSIRRNRMVRVLPS